MKTYFILTFLLLWIALSTGCAANYKGVSVYIVQDTEVDADRGSTASGGSHADSERVPEHQQGSDTLVPILKQVVDSFKIEAELATDMFKECRKLSDDLGVDSCSGLVIPKRPNITLPGAGESDTDSDSPPPPEFQ